MLLDSLSAAGLDRHEKALIQESTNRLMIQGLDFDPVKGRGPEQLSVTPQLYFIIVHML